MRRIKIFLLVGVITFTACEKDFIPPEQQSAKMMTVNCLFDNYGVFRVYLTESSAPGNNNVISLSDAVVGVYENGAFKETMSYIPSDSLNTFGSFQSSFIPAFEKKYLVKINHPVFGETTAEDVMPALAPIVSSKLIAKGSYAPYQDAIAEISFDDDANTENFYRLNPWLWVSWAIYDPATGDSSHAEFFGLRVRVEESLADTVRDNNWALLFSDKNFNGQHKTLRLHFKPFTNFYFVANVHDSMNLHIDLNNVSKTHYEYFRTLEIYRQSDDDQEQPDVSGNIQNGYGIFAGSAVSTGVIGIK